VGRGGVVGWAGEGREDGRERRGRRDRRGENVFASSVLKSGYGPASWLVMDSW
jgi:hypothetical protein